MTIGRRPRLAAMLATSLGGVLVAGALAVAPGSAAGEATAAAEPAALGWAVTNLSTSAVPQTDDAVAADADGSTVAVRWRPCAPSCRRESYLRISTDSGRTFGPVRKVDDGANGPAVAVAGEDVLTVSDGFTGLAKPVIRVDRWSTSGASSTPETVEIATTASPTNLHLAASGDRAVLTYRVASDVFVARTDDGGTTWSAPVVVAVGNGDVDLDVNGTKAALVASAGAGTWTVRVSADAGTTWGTPRTLAAGRDGGTSRVAITTGGAIAFGLSYADAGSRRGEVRTSADGVTWSEPTKLANLLATQMLDVTAEGDTFFASGDGQNLHRSTGGGSWGRVVEYSRVVTSLAAHERQFANAGRTTVAVSASGPVVMHGSTLLRSFADTRTPSVRFTAVPPAVTKVANQVVRFAATDADSADAWLTYECGYGNNAWFEECSSPHQISRWSPEVAGRNQVLRVRATDAAGRVSPVVTARWILDQAAPEPPYRTTEQEITTASRHTFRWRGSDADSGIASYDLRWSSTAQTASRMSHAWRSAGGVRGTSVRLGVARGKVTCLQVRARDRAGLASAWSQPDCIARPYDDRSLVRSGTTKKVRDKRFYGGSATRLTRKGRLTLRGVEAGSVVHVVYKKSPRMGAGILRPRGNVNYLFGERGTTRFRATWRFHDNVRRPGPVSVRVSQPGSIVIDGLAVLPRWAR